MSPIAISPASYHCDVILIMTSCSLWRHSLLSWPRPPLRTYGRTHVMDTLPRLIYRDIAYSVVTITHDRSPTYINDFVTFSLHWQLSTSPHSSSTRTRPSFVEQQLSSADVCRQSVNWTSWTVYHRDWKTCWLPRHLSTSTRDLPHLPSNFLIMIMKIFISLE